MANVKALVEDLSVITEHSSAARELHAKQSFGAMREDGRVQLSPLEAVYLVGKKKLALSNGKNQPMGLDRFVAKVRRKDKNFWVRYAVFKNLRDQGYVVKTALKFGADFRVYERGTKPGEEHARWIAFPVSEHDRLTWQEFSAKNRVAHSTKKHLLMCVVDDEGDVSYWEVRWTRP